MPRHIDTFTEGTLTLTSDDVVPVVVEVSCQITTVRLVATSSVETTPGVLCDPSEVDVPLPSKYTVELTYNQDNEQAAGISQFLWEHDAEKGTFSITNGPTDPSVTGDCYFVAGDFGGDAGKPMTDSKVLNVIGKPDRTFGVGTTATAAEAEANGRSTETVDACGVGTSKSGAEFSGKIQRFAVEISKLPRTSSYENAKLGKATMERAVQAMAPGGRLAGVGRRGAKIGARYTVYADGNCQISMRGPVWLVEENTAAHDISPKRTRSSKALYGAGYDHPYRGTVHHKGTTGKHVWVRTRDEVLPPLLRTNITRAMHSAAMAAFK